MKKTMVLGASPNVERTSYAALLQLLEGGHEVVAVGSREGSIAGVPIHTGTPPVADLHTVTLYIRPTLQIPLYDYILGLKPKRIIFNPGTENPELMQLAQNQGIETKNGCTLVMVALGRY